MALSQPQIPSPEVYRDAMKRFAFMEGEWSGEGWMEMTPGQRHTFTQTERVEFRQEGTILMVVGQGLGPAGERKVHDAFGVISFDAASGTYTLTAWSYPGRKGEFELLPEENGFEWGFKNGPATIRYRMRLDENGHWHETGEMSLDDETWRTFLEFTVKRVSSEG